ncbi:MAG: DNA modification methylase [Chloroflexota bacterium]
MSNDPLKFDERNANKGTERGRELLEQSVTELGAGRSILSDKNGRIIAGNKTLAAARKAGLNVRIVPSGRNELIVVQREDLDLEDGSGEARRLAYLDNRVAELDLAWDASVIAEDAAAGMDMDALGFLDKELQKLLMDVEHQVKEETADPVELVEHADELVAKWKVEVGQVWKLGEHRLAVGDCTDAAVMVALMQGELAQITWTDPPWNVDYGGNIEEQNAQGYKKRTMKNDNLGEKFPEFIRTAVKNMHDFSEKGALIYLVMSAQEWPVIDKALRDHGFHWSSTIIWMKDQLVLSRKDYHTQFEPLWYGWRSDAGRLREVVDRKQSDVWQIDRPKRSDDHPTMKPLPLVERSLANSSLPGDIVLDPFVGSGTTLIVCEQLGRRCRAVELDEAYAAVVIERWAQFSGQVPVISNQ